MNGAVCPSCGVAVVPGYARCPKCRKPLPRRQSMVEGGTALPDKRRFPLVAVIAVAVIGGAIIVWFGMRSGDHKATAAPTQEPAEEPVANTTEPVAAGPDLQGDTANNEQAAARAAAELERALKKQRLWSTVSVVGGRIEVRSGSCADPAMVPLIDVAAPSFKAAGLTKVRCVEQSGKVVSNRDL